MKSPRAWLNAVEKSPKDIRPVIKTKPGMRRIESAPTCECLEPHEMGVSVTGAALTKWERPSNEGNSSEAADSASDPNPKDPLIHRQTKPGRHKSQRKPLSMRGLRARSLT